MQSGIEEQKIPLTIHQSQSKKEIQREQSAFAPLINKSKLLQLENYVVDVK